MNQVHGKTFSLQHITVKVPGQFMPIAKPTNLSPHSSLPVDTPTLGGGSHSDCSESVSPATYSAEKLKTNGDCTDTSITVTPSSPVMRGTHQPKSPTSEDDTADMVDELSRSDKYPFSHRAISHMRNSSMDEITLQLLKSQGASYPPNNSQEEPPRERASTLTRLQTKKSYKMVTAMLSPISHSEEDLSEPQRSGSAENLKSSSVMKRGSKKGEGTRNSFILVERTSSDSVPNREDLRKDKKQQGKHRRQRSQGVFKNLEVDACELYICTSAE